MKIKLFNTSIIILMLLLVSAPNFIAEGVKGSKVNSLSKTNGSPSYARLNINKISTWIKNDGETDVNQNGNSGFVYPKGTNKACVFQSGFIWGGKYDGQIRVGGSTYNQGLSGGALINGTPEDPSADHVRIYRVRRDYKTGNLSPEAQDENLSVSEVFAQYEKDWNEWPVSYGAPYEDVDGNGSYDPNIDIPGEPGADQTVWFVANDDDAENIYGSLPMQIEMQATIFAYNRIGPLGSTLFRKYLIVNKSNVDFTDFYVCMWSDPDVGDATDDFVGCDTTLSVGYCYNGNPTDATYGENPPATGFDFFQGPVVDGEATDTAKALGRRIPGKKNLGMSAFFFFINSDPVYSDPGLQSYAEGTLEMYNLFQGRIGTTGQPFIDPTNNQPTKFTLYGNPADPNETGWLDGLLHPVGDRRFGQVAGPFTMAAGDTQEVVVGQFAAGAVAGVDALQAIDIMKQYDVVAQATYDADFEVPGAPKQPVVKQIELDGAIVLNWGSDPEVIKETEGHKSQGYEFQGYNVYQLPFVNAGLNESKKIATFDIVDGIKNIVVNDIDPNTGVEISVVSQSGTDSGIKRFIKIDRDFIKNLTLVNGNRYFFAVTSYAYNPDPLAVPQVLENDLIPLTLVTRTPDPGVRLGADFGASISATRTSGKSDGTVDVSIVDPNALNGHNYKVTFTDVTVDDGAGHLSTHTEWTLTDVNSGAVRLTGQQNLTGDNDYLVVDGMQVITAGPPPGVNPDHSFDVPSGARKFTWSNANFGFEGFNGAIGYASPANVFGGSDMVVAASDLFPVNLILAKVDHADVLFDPPFDNTDVNMSYGYRYGRGFTGKAAKPEFEPHIVNAVGGYSFQEFAKTIPLSAWDMSDPDNPRRLALAYLENNSANGLVDGKYWPSDASLDNVGSAGPREWLFVINDDYTETSKTEYEAELIGNAAMPIMYWLSVNRRGAVPFSPGGTGEDQFTIINNNPITPNDVFEFTAPNSGYDEALAKEDVNEINVFPNPYYGVNSEELNKYQRFVTFNHLPAKATIRIFNLAGQLVRTIDKNSTNQYERWDLSNSSGLPVASGLYIVYVDMPDLGTTKTLKVAIIQEQQVLDRF